MGALIAAAAIAGGAAIGGAVLKGGAARKAANARKDALNKMELIDLGKTQEIALAADKERFKNQIALQKELDPTLAAIREGGAKGVLDTLYTEQDKQAEALGTKLYEETKEDTPGMQALKEKLLEDANADLARGAELPPEFQAELVRTGLEKAGKAGFAPGAEGMAGRTAREMLGAGGLALKEARRKAAVESATGVQNMNATRASILSRVIPTLNSITAARAQRAGLAFGLAEGAMPEAGLSGAEMANLDLARIKQQNDKMKALGGVAAEKAIAEGEMWASILSAGGSMAGGVIGAATTPSSTTALTTAANANKGAAADPYGNIWRGGSGLYGSGGMMGMNP